MRCSKLAALLAVAALAVVLAQPASAQATLSPLCRTQATGGNCPPDAPCPQPCLPSGNLDNIDIFVDRDYVSISDYSGFTGQTATVQVLHSTNPNGLTGPFVIAGAAQGVISGGEVAFEVNHPGGVCWGAGFEENPALQVTPDIVYGDVVRLILPNGVINEVRASRGEALSINLDETVLTIRGQAGAAVVATGQDLVPPAPFISIRIINPDLVDTAVGRRDVRADVVSATPVTDRSGAYSYVWTFDAGFEGQARQPWTAVFTFTDPAVAALAARPLELDVTTWLDQDAAGNPQGSTHSEFFSFDGPQFGGCPPGPSDLPVPTGFLVSSDHVLASDETTPCDGTDAPGVLKVIYTQPVPASAVGGYVVTALDTATGVGVSARVMGADITSVTVPDVPCNRIVKTEVRAFRPSATMVDVTDLSVPFPPYEPSLTASPSPSPNASTPTAAQTITLTTNLDSNVICYALTTDGSEPPVLNDPEVINANPPVCTVYDGMPISIPAGSVVGFSAVAVTTVGPELVQQLIPSPGFYERIRVPPAPTIVTAISTTTATSGAILVRWNSAGTGADAATTFLISARSENGAVIPQAQLGTAAIQPANARSALITSLPPGLYTFTVTARNAAGTSAASATSNAARVTDLVTVDAGFPVFRAANRELRIRGTSSQQSGTVRVFTTNDPAQPFQLDITQGCGAGCNINAGRFNIRYDVPTTTVVRDFITVRSQFQGFTTERVVRN